jgi:hypothetical protein
VTVAAAKAESAAPASQGRAWLSKWSAFASALALALLAAGALAWRAGLAPHFMAASVDDKLANAPHLSIVVLPFENLSGDKEQDYFADAIISRPKRFRLTDTAEATSPKSGPLWPLKAPRGSRRGCFPASKRRWRI